MAEVLPQVNQNNESVMEVLQASVDESIVRENHIIEEMEDQNSMLASIFKSINELLIPLNSIEELLSQDRERTQQQAITQDIAEENPGVQDVSGSRGASSGLFDQIEGLDGSMIGNIIGAAVLAYMYDVDEIIRTLSAGFTKTFKNVVRGVFNAPLNAFRSVSSFIKGLDFSEDMRRVINGIIKPFSATFNTIGRLLQPIMETFRKVANSGLGRIARTFLGPFTLAIFGIIDFVKGFVQGFRENGLIGGLKGGLGELLANMVGIPLDMVKDLTAWVADQFGWESISKTLEDFSFKDLIKDTFDRIWEFFENLFKNPLETFRDVIFGDDEERSDRVNELLERGSIEDSDPTAPSSMEDPFMPGSEKRPSWMLSPEELKKYQDNNIEQDKGVKESGKAVGDGSNQQAAQRERATAAQAAMSINPVVSAPVDNSQTNVSNKKTEITNNPGPRSSEHSYRRRQDRLIR